MKSQPSYVESLTRPEADYPEHEKLHRVKQESQAQGQFLEWLDSEGYILCQFEGLHNEWIPVRITAEKLLARYHRIDLEKLESEKRAMLEELRKANT